MAMTFVEFFDMHKENMGRTSRYYGLNPNPAVRTIKMGSKKAKIMGF